MSRRDDKKFIEPSPELKAKLDEWYELDERTAYMRTDAQRAELERLHLEIMDLKAKEGIGS